MSILSLCAGYGGLDDAVSTVTGESVAAYAEIMAEASAVLKLKYPDLVNLGDVTVVDWTSVAERWPDADVICAGFPCTDISEAGNMDGITGLKSRVWFDVLAAVNVIKPRLLFLENVDVIRTNGLDTVTAGLISSGYTLVWTVLRASAVGAPHPRDRWFGVAAPSDSPVCIEIPRASNDKVPSGVFGTPLVSSTSGAGDMFNRRNQSRLGTQSVTDPDNPYWVDRRPAIRLWEAVTGRQAPSMSNDNPDSKMGKQLSPRFVEWMMGLEEGRVTSDDIGLSRGGQLKVLGGVWCPCRPFELTQHYWKTWR